MKTGEIPSSPRTCPQHKICMFFTFFFRLLILGKFLLETSKGSTINHLGGVVRIFVNKFFFRRPTERFFLAKFTEFRVKLTELNFFFGGPLDEFFFGDIPNGFFVRFAPRPSQIINGQPLSNHTYQQAASDSSNEVQNEKLCCFTIAGKTWLDLGVAGG